MKIKKLTFNLNHSINITYNTNYIGYKLQIPFALDLNAHKYLKSLAVFPRIWVNHSPLVIRGGLGSDGSGRVVFGGKYFILPDRFGFEEMKSVDRPLCGRIGRIGWLGLSGREWSGDRVLTISSNSKSNSNYKVKKRKKKFNQQPQISKSEQMS